MALTLPFPWATVFIGHHGWSRSQLCGDTVLHTGLAMRRVCCEEWGHVHEHEPLGSARGTLVTLLVVAAINGVALMGPLEGRRRRAFQLASCTATILVLVASRPHLLLRDELEIYREWALWAFSSLWVALLLLHAWELPRFTWWLATGPRRLLAQELASAAALAVFPAAVLAGYAAFAHAIWPGALEGGGLLFVPARVAIALSVCGGGFGLALWYRLTRPEPERPRERLLPRPNLRSPRADPR